MSRKRIVLRNALWNYLGTAVEFAVGLVVAPFLFASLGATTYGLWIVIGSLTSYFGLLDVGVRGSVGRWIAFHHARNDRAAIDGTLSTALVLLSAVGVLVLCCVGLSLPSFPDWFSVPAEQAAEARCALLLVGINLSLTFLLNTFDGVLWAFQRFDLLNMVDIPAALFRCGASVWVVSQGHGLIALACVTLLVTIGGGLAKAVLSFREDPDLRLNFGTASRAGARSLLGYGLWNFILNICRITRGQLVQVAIGAWLGLAFVAIYAVAKRLIDHSDRVLWTMTGVLTPLAAALEAQEERSKQQRLFLEGSRYCWSAALGMVVLLVCLGESLIGLWMGAALTPAATLLAILAFGDLLPMSQTLTGSLIQGMARHKVLAWLGLAEIGMGLLLTGLLLLTVPRFWPGPWFGLPAELTPLAALCCAMAISASWCRGVLVIAYGCHVTSVVWRDYCRRALLPAALLAFGPTVGLAAASAWHRPATWPELIAYGLAFSLVYGGVCLLLPNWHRLPLPPVAAIRLPNLLRRTVGSS
jgi:O-antigen/teichoic acid export membrane protein